jgi:arylsulfatase A
MMKGGGEFSGIRKMRSHSGQPLFFCTRNVLSVLGCVLFFLLGNARAHEKPNILIILADDMGYGDLRCFQPSSKIATPHLDRLAQEGMKWTNAHAAGPVCHPSRYGLMTGCYPFRTDVSVWAKQPLIAPGQMTIASLLQSQGYATHMVGKWHLGFAEHGYDQALKGGPIAHGFGSFFGLRASTDIPPYFWIRGEKAVAPPSGRISGHQSEGWSPIQGEFWREGGIAPGMDLSKVLTQCVDESISVITAHAADKEKSPPFFLYTALTAPHTPWLPTEEWRGKSGAGMYGDFVMMVDAEIGRILRALDQAHLARNTIVIFSSDNGPVWYPQDRARYQHDASGGLRGMKGDAWEGGHRMPFIVRWPERVKPGSSSDHLLCFTDLLATFAELCHAALPEQAGPDSFSFLPILLNQSPNLPSSLRSTFVLQTVGLRPLTTIQNQRWKFIDGPGSGGFSKMPTKEKTSGPQLYDLRADPGETTNLSATHPAMVEEMRAQMQKIVKDGRSR